MLATRDRVVVSLLESAWGGLGRGEMLEEGRDQLAALVQQAAVSRPR